MFIYIKNIKKKKKMKDYLKIKINLKKLFFFFFFFFKKKIKDYIFK